MIRHEIWGRPHFYTQQIPRVVGPHFRGDIS